MQEKAYRLGTHRTRTPGDTLRQLEPLLPALGITRVANVTGLDRVGIPVYNAFRPLSRSISVSQGKGSEPLAAKVSAIMESVESFHAELIQLETRPGSINDLERSLRLADTDTMAYASPTRLDRHTSIHWLEGVDLFDGQPRWLPLEPVSTDYRYPAPPGHGHFAANTNGLASGNSPSEAVSHAIYEVVERDAEALWSQRPGRQQALTGIDPDSVEDPNCRWLMKHFEEANLETAIWDLTSDIGLPCFTCLVLGDEQDWADPETGTGCHPSREVALARALTEAAQARATFIAGSRDDVGLSEYRFRQRRKRRAQALRQLHWHQPEIHFEKVPGYDNPDIDADLRLSLDLLERIGVEQVIAVDLTRDDFRLPVVKVVIPGLEGAFGHWHGAYIPGQRAREKLGLPLEMLG